MIEAPWLASSTMAVIDKPQRRRLTVDDFANMCKAGILTADDRVELIDGELVEMPPMAPEHAGIVNRLAEVLIVRLGDAADLRVQSSVLLSRYTQPEPDLAVVRPNPGHYLQRHPQPNDILIAIEVADSSLGYDREEKMPRYGAAGIPEAWLIDVNAKTITVYTEPRSTGYRNTLTLAWTEEVVARAIEGLSLVFEDILPSAYFPR